MESHRQGRRVIPVARDRQRGITFIGLVILAMLVGVVGLAALKVTPMYIMNMKLSKALGDIPEQLEGKEVTPQNIRYALAKRFSVEDINLTDNSIKITPSKNGFAVRIQYENRAPYIADVWLLVAFDRSVEIKK
jgi:Tfp pilus assembly protein PilE